MAKNLKKMISAILALVMCLCAMLPAFASESEIPEVTINLTPGENTTGSATNGNLVREVSATTSAIETIINDSYGELTAPQSVLKFNRNSTTNQKAQKAATELYTDNGHFTDPEAFTVTDAPKGYPFKFIGTGDYSGHYISVVRVVYERDEDGNAI